jgi:hypothetical protein
MFVPADAGLAFVFKECFREHSALCDRERDAEGGRQDKPDGTRIDRNRLIIVASVSVALACSTRVADRIVLGDLEALSDPPVVAPA